MIKKIIIVTISIVVFAVIAVALAGMYKFNYLANQPGYDVDGNRVEDVVDENTEDVGNNVVACTADAMMCPDGSYVGRTGPNCEFICPEVVDVLNSPVEILKITQDKIYFDGGPDDNGLHIDSFPDSVVVSEDSSFGSSDIINFAMSSPNGEWIAISVSGATHDFGWLYDVKNNNLNPIAFSYGGGVSIDRWDGNDKIVFKISTPKPSIQEIIIDVNNLPEYPKVQ